MPIWFNSFSTVYLQLATIKHKIVRLRYFFGLFVFNSPESFKIAYSTEFLFHSCWIQNKKRCLKITDIHGDMDSIIARWDIFPSLLQHLWSHHTGIAPNKMHWPKRDSSSTRHCTNSPTFSFSTWME